MRHEHVIKKATETITIVSLLFSSFYCEDHIDTFILVDDENGRSSFHDNDVLKVVSVSELVKARALAHQKFYG
jgi:hypothetical protein